MTVSSLMLRKKEGPREVTPQLATRTSFTIELYCCYVLVPPVHKPSLDYSFALFERLADLFDEKFLPRKLQFELKEAK